MEVRLNAPLACCQADGYGDWHRRTCRCSNPWHPNTPLLWADLSLAFPQISLGGCLHQRYASMFGRGHGLLCACAAGGASTANPIELPLLEALPHKRCHGTDVDGADDAC